MDATIAGGKGASLGEMTQAGIPVPEGFVVLSSTFDHFLQETDLTQEIETILKNVDHKAIHTVESASEKVRGLIEAQEIPEDIANEVVEAFKILRAEFVAVRSSATAEDGAEHAWAGQLDSFLNTTEKNLLENVKKCWSSLFTPRAIFYRFEKELHGTQISVAVVVQKMIQSEASGIAFSVHPITEDRNQLIVEAGYGLGEAIVSGAITPDSYVVEKEPRKIIDTNVNTQKRGIFKKADGGNEWKELSEPKASSQVLNEKEILELADLVMKIEKHYGFPCDIEWAYENERFYITQSRPITTLSNKPFVRQFKKFFTRNIPVVTMEYWWEGEYKAFNQILDGATRFNPLFIRTAKGQVNVYYDINNPDTSVKPLFDFFIKHPDSFEVAAKKFEEDYQQLKKLSENYRQADLQDFYSRFVRFWSFLPVIVQFGNPNGEGLPKHIVDRAYKLRELSQAGEYTIGDALIKTIEFQHPDVAEYSDVVSIRELVSNTIPDRDILETRKGGFIFFENQLIAGKDLNKFQQENNIHVDDNLAILGDYSKKSPNLNSEIIFEGHLMTFKGKRLANMHEASLKVLGRSKVWKRELGVGYKVAIMNSLGEYYVDKESDAQLYEILKTKDISFADKYIEKLHNLGVNLLREMTQRPHQNFDEGFSEMMGYFFIVKSIFEIIYKTSTSEEQKLIEKWRMDNAIFESLELYYKNNPAKDEKSTDDWSWVFNNETLTFYNELMTFKKEGAEVTHPETSTMIKGNSAFPGIVQGKVRIILSKIDKDLVEEGEIIVAPMTTVDFLPAMIKAIAFITDEGGITSHAAIVAREMRKPCVIGTKIATKALKTGDMVEVDADKGIVRIIK